MNTDQNGFKHGELTEKIIGTFFDVYNELGHGFLESVYEEWPERTDYCFELARCQLNLGLNDEAVPAARGVSNRTPADRTVAVWDLPLRLWHWALAASVLPR